MLKGVEEDTFLAATENVLINAQETITVLCATIAAAKGKAEKN